MNNFEDSFEELKEQIRKYQKKLRNLSKEENKKDMRLLKKVIFTEERHSYIDNEYVKRLVLFLRGTGCSHATETGGCTFCGFYNATNFGEKIRDEDYIIQIKDVMNNGSSFKKYPIICLYNDGSMLREEEISFDTVINIITILHSVDSIRRVVIESRVEDITLEKVAKLRETTDKEIEIAVGFESANAIIRDLCINKSFNNSKFEEICCLAQEYNISIIPLMILKPPFLTEQEAIDDYIQSLQYLEQFNLKRIDMELPTVEKFTLVYDLWKYNMYEPAKLWSVVEILNKRHSLRLKTPIYISPTNYSVSAEAKASNCENCNNFFYKAFEEFNICKDISVFNDIDCSCKKEWEDMLICQKNVKDLPKHVHYIMNELERIKV